MTETIPVRVQHKRMSARDWASSTLVLLDGELGIESDTGKVKVGNGRDRFSALQYLTGPKGDRGETGPAGPRGADGVVRFEGSAAERALTEYAKKSETPVYRIAKGDIAGTGDGGTQTIDKNYILNRVEKIKNIPIHIAHGRFDLNTRVVSAYKLAEKLNNCELIIVEGVGHSPFTEKMSKVLIKFLEDIKELNYKDEENR